MREIADLAPHFNHAPLCGRGKWKLAAAAACDLHMFPFVASSLVWLRFEIAACWGKKKKRSVIIDWQASARSSEKSSNPD